MKIRYFPYCLMKTFMTAHKILILIVTAHVLWCSNRDASENVVCCIYLLTLLTNVSVEANDVDPDLNVTVGAERSGSTLFDQKTSKHFSRQLLL